MNTARVFSAKLSSRRLGKLSNQRFIRNGPTRPRPEVSFHEIPRRSYLYVPASSDRMLKKALTTDVDTIIFDLEDSVAPDSKASARSSLVNFLQGDIISVAHSSQIAVRINDITTPHFKSDVEALGSLQRDIVSCIVIPKVEDESPMAYIRENATKNQNWHVIASIESAHAMWNLGSIAGYKSLEGERKVQLVALLFAAEDYCASTSIQRSPSRTELLYPRSQLVTASKAFGLHAIDMVNVNYQDEEYHKEECLEGRRLGFTGKQAIHPSQLAGINEAFRPTEKEILRAAKILHHMSLTHASGSGAFGLELEGNKGKKEMIDAPMVKQAEATIQVARLCRLEIPKITSQVQ